MNGEAFSFALTGKPYTERERRARTAPVLDVGSLENPMAAGHVTKSLYVRLIAKPGKEAEVEAFLHAGLPIVEEESGTVAWFALKLDASTYAIFDVFPDDSAREAHLAGRVGTALMQKAPELLAEPPSIERIDVLASKLPG